MDDDSWRYVFRYLTVRERILYERVSKRWMKLLREHWKCLDSVDSNELCCGVQLDQWTHCVHGVLVRCSPHITSFSFGRDRRELRQLGTKKPLLPEVLIELVQKAPALRSFRVEDCFLYRNTVAMLTKLPPTLKIFCAERCVIDCIEHNFVSTCFLSLLEHCSTLEEFVITGRGLCYGYLHIDDYFMQHIPPTVSVLCVSAGEALKITDAAFVSRLAKLRSFDAQRSLLSHKPLEKLVLNAPNLLYLDLSYSRFLENFSPIGKLTQLRCLLLNGNRSNLTNIHLYAIINGCKSLEVLSLEGCSKLSSVGLRAISRCAALKELHVSGVTGMTDDTLTSIVFGTTLLRVLDISYCKALTMAGLESLTVLQNLDHLCVNGIYDVDEHFVDMLRECRPYCQIEAIHCKYSMSMDELLQNAIFARIIEPAPVCSSYQLSRYQYL